MHANLEKIVKVSSDFQAFSQCHKSARDWVIKGEAQSATYSKGVGRSLRISSKKNCHLYNFFCVFFGRLSKTFTIPLRFLSFIFNLPVQLLLRSTNVDSIPTATNTSPTAVVQQELLDSEKNEDTQPVRLRLIVSPIHVQCS